MEITHNASHPAVIVDLKYVFAEVEKVTRVLTRSFVEVRESICRHSLSGVLILELDEALRGMLLRM